MTKIRTLLVAVFVVIGVTSNALAGTPIDIKKTNIRDNQFTISWITSAVEIGSINYGTTPSLGSTKQDDKGSGVFTDTHHVTVTGLVQNKLYYYDIISGGVTYNNGGAHYTVTTGPALGPAPGGPDFVYGRVYLPDGSYAVGATVYINLSDNNGSGTSGTSQDASSIVDSNGWWNYNLANLRKPDLSGYFIYSASGDNEILTAKKGMNDSATQTIDTGNDYPAPDMTLGWALNMIDMQWRQKESYSSAACCEMILDYIRQGLASDLGQTAIYNYAHPASDSKEMTPYEMARTLGHFDPYDSIVSNWLDFADTYPGGNSMQGYNYSVDTYDSAEPDAINEYMRDICHWMAFTVTKEEYWKDGELVQRPNTPAAVPIFGNTLGYDHWVVVKGAATSTNPMPEPHVNPYDTPDFTIYGFWIKDPDISGIGQNTYKTAAECAANYFKPLNTGGDYNGMYVQVAEPPAEPGKASINIEESVADEGNLEFIGVQPAITTMQPASSAALSAGKNTSGDSFSKKSLKKASWKDLVDPHILTDPEAIAAFDGTRMGRPILVHRLDTEDADYYLVPFDKNVKRRGFLTSAVIILDAEKGYFKEATWMKEPQTYLNISRGEAISLVMWKIIRAHKKCRFYDMNSQLVWESGEISASPYQPFWQVSTKDSVWYVTQDGDIIEQK